MKKWIIASILTIVVLGVATFAWSGTVFARNVYNNYGPYGQAMMMGGGYYDDMYDSMVSALADELEMNPEDIDARFQAGETPWQIAQAEGLNNEDIQTLMQVAHDQTLQAMVDAGQLTQEQANWMDEHMDSMWSGEFNNFGYCHGANSWNNSDGANLYNRYSPMMGGRWGNSD